MGNEDSSHADLLPGDYIFARHYVIFQYDANGVIGQLYRHFILTDDGSIIEVFDQYKSKDNSALIYSKFYHNRVNSGIDV